MEKELISVEKRNGVEVRYYIDEDGRETMEEITGCAACETTEPAGGNTKEGLCGSG